MADLHVDFLGKRLAGPVIASSGTFGFGPENAVNEALRVLGDSTGTELTITRRPPRARRRRGRQRGAHAQPRAAPREHEPAGRKHPRDVQGR